MFLGLGMSFQFPGQRSGDFVSDAGTDGHDELILVFGKWSMLEPEGFQFLPANLIQAKTQRGQLGRGAFRHQFFPEALNFREHNLFGLALARPRAGPWRNGPLQILYVVQQHTFKLADS